MSPAHRAYMARLINLEIPAGPHWEERYILALVANHLMLCAEPMAGYHIMAPMPTMGSVIGWEQCYIVERP